MRAPARRRLALVAALGTVLAGAFVAAPADAALRGAPAPSCSAGVCTVTFDYTGAPETWTVPAHVRSLTATVAGASGGSAANRAGGTGGVVTGTVPVTSGDELTVRVGQAGSENLSFEVPGTYGGGGAGTVYGSGGGGSFLSRRGDLLLVAGGGGGAGSGADSGTGGAGGGGSSLVGRGGDGHDEEDAWYGNGLGATTTAGGKDGQRRASGTGPATSTTFGVGGSPTDNGSGAGGGYFGGGAGGPGASNTTGGAGGGSGFAAPAPTVVLGTPAVPTNAGNGRVTLTYAEPVVVPSVATIALASDHAVAGGQTQATVTVTAGLADDLAGGAVQLLVDGKKSGAPVPVTAVGTKATAKLTVPATGVGAHKVSATFTATEPDAGATTASTPFTVLPATLPWTLTDAAGNPITSPLASPDVVAHATGQLPGATVRLEVKIDGTFTDLDMEENGTVAQDGTVDVPIASPLLLTLFGDDFTKDATFDLRLVAVSPFKDTPDLASTAKKVTVPGVDIPVDLQVDPGPYRAGDDVDNAVRVTLRWFDEENPFLSADDITDALDDGDLTLYLDRKPVDPRDVVVGSADDETAVLSFGAPEAGGDHTVQAVLTFESFSGTPITSASKVRHFTVAPSTFDAALLDDEGNPVTTVHPGDKLHAAAAGLLPGTVVDFELHSDPVLLGSATADEDGLAVSAVTIPASTTPGKHTLVVTATDVLGDAHVQRVALTVVAAPTPSATPTPVDDPLAATGSNVAPVVGLGALLVLVGAGLLLVVRRRRV